MEVTMTLMQRVQSIRTKFSKGESVGRTAFTDLLADVETELKRTEPVATADPVGRVFKLLSFTQRKAIVAIAGELTDGSGLVIASKIADRAGITRSVFTSTIRSFESAGVIKSDSLGVKGTHIKSLMPGWTERLTVA